MLSLLGLAGAVTLFPRYGTYVAAPVLHGAFSCSTAAARWMCSSPVWLHPALSSMIRSRRIRLNLEPDGTAILLNGPGGSGVYLIRATTMPQSQEGQVLRYTITLSHLARNGERFDLKNKKTAEPWYTIGIDGAQPSAYNPNPYQL